MFPTHSHIRPKPELLCSAVCALLLVSGCEPGGRAADAKGPHPRMVIFAPALTLIAFELGLGDHVVGVDQHSGLSGLEPRPVVGSALAVRVEPILALHPDVLLVNLDPAQFEPVSLVDPSIRIEHFDFLSLADIPRAMKRVARIAGKPDAGEAAALAFGERLQRVGSALEGRPACKVMFVIGHRSPWGPGREDFVDEMLTIAGGDNVLRSLHSGWKGVSVEFVIDLDPRVIICQSRAEDEAEARAYWEAIEVPDGGEPRRVFVVTDPRWTLPAGHIAALVEELAEMLHGPRALEREGRSDGS